jgi:ribosome modulation factor
MRNDDDQLPRFSGQVLMSREENWSYGVVEEDKSKLQPLLDTLRRLHQRGLMAGMVAAAFHRRRVLPLTQRRLWLNEMTPEVSLGGSRMSHESLPLDEVARRARWMVGSFKQEDIDRVPMCPTQGFEPLVSVIFDSLESFCFLIPSTKSVEASVQDLSVVKESRPPVPKDRASREARCLSVA